MGKAYLWAYFFVNLGTMFTIQSAVTVVTAGLASQLFGITDDIVSWSLLITLFCALTLLIGRYQLLDKFIKIIMVTLAISSLLSVGVAFLRMREPFLFNKFFLREVVCFFDRFFRVDACPIGHFDLALHLDT